MNILWDTKYTKYTCSLDLLQNLALLQNHQSVNAKASASALHRSARCNFFDMPFRCVWNSKSFNISLQGAEVTILDAEENGQSFQEKLPLWR